LIRTDFLGSNGHANQHKSFKYSTLTMPEMEKYPARVANQAIFTCRTGQKLPGRQGNSSG